MKYLIWPGLFLGVSICSNGFSKFQCDAETLVRAELKANAMCNVEAIESCNQGPFHFGEQRKTWVWHPYRAITALAECKLLQKNHQQIWLDLMPSPPELKDSWHCFFQLSENGKIEQHEVVGIFSGAASKFCYGGT